MPDSHLLGTEGAAPTSGRTSDGLLDSLQRWRDADRTGAPEAFVPELRAIDANRAVIEQAKGALMLHYRINSYQAFAVLVRWSRVTQLPVRTVAHTLVHGICEGSPQTEVRHRPLIRWLEDQLRHTDPDPARIPTEPV
jgi:hypothetical protein